MGRIIRKGSETMIVSGKKIKEYREKRSMTKAELSKNAGVPYDTLMSWEMERRIPRDVSLVSPSE